MRKTINTLMQAYLGYRFNKIQDQINDAKTIQLFWLNHILSVGANANYAKAVQSHKIKNYEDFQSAFPIVQYEDIFPSIQKMMHGAKNELWTGNIKWYSKSSGTSNGKSKYIPLSAENIVKNHIKGTWDTMCCQYNRRPNSTMFQHKTLLMGGCIEEFEPNPNIQIGDISAVMIKHMPFVARPFFTPSFELALEKNWDYKIDEMARQLIKEPDMVMLGGVPTWTLVLLKKIMNLAQTDNLLDIWPKLTAYSHGGVNFAPYRKQFEAIIPKPDFDYVNIYNSSEGFFGVQDDLSIDAMLLLLNSGVFYEFIPMADWTKGKREAIPLWETEVGVNYVLVVTNNSGLWRYVVGDTIQFVSKRPPRFQITGRVSQFINVFGEELMVHNTDKALELLCEKHNLEVIEYTVAPVWMTAKNKGGHEWAVAFEKSPKDFRKIEKELDAILQELNSDYQAKRFGNLALNPLKLNVVPKNTFEEWQRREKRYGGQNKIMRLSNDRIFLESLLAIANEKCSTY